MSANMEIRESETGMVRVFHLDLPNEAIERYTVQAGTGEWPLMYGLGAKKLSAAHIDIVDLRDLEGMALTSYLQEAHGLPAAALKDHAPQLNRLRGHVLILPSNAFARTAQTITARTPLRWIGTFEADKARMMAPPIKSKSAKRGGAVEQNPQISTEIDGKTKIMIALGLLAVVVIVAFLL